MLGGYLHTLVLVLAIVIVRELRKIHKLFIEQ